MEDPQNTEDSGKIIVPTPLPATAQQWVLEDFKATEISNSCKHFLVAPEDQPEPPNPAQAVMEVAPPKPTEAATELEEFITEAHDLIGEEVLPETVTLDGASEAKEYEETAEVSTMLEEGPAAVVEEVTSALTEVSSEDAISPDEALLSEAAVVQEVVELESPACKGSTAEAPALVSAAAHGSSGPGKMELLFFPFFSTLSRICMRETCVVCSFLLAIQHT